MARRRLTARKRLPTTASPEQVIRAYRSYGRCHGDDMGEFLAHYRRYWADAHTFGATHYDGVQRLIRLLPDPWQTIARDASDDYITTAEGSYDLVGDLPGFVIRLFTVFARDPQGRPPERCTRPRLDTEHPVPVVAPQEALPAPFQPGRHDFEAGPSRPQRRLIIIPPSRPVLGTTVVPPVPMDEPRPLLPPRKRAEVRRSSSLDEGIVPILVPSEEPSEEDPDEDPEEERDPARIVSSQGSVS